VPLPHPGVACPAKLTQATHCSTRHRHALAEELVVQAAEALHLRWKRTRCRQTSRLWARLSLYVFVLTDSSCLSEL